MMNRVRNRRMVLIVVWVFQALPLNAATYVHTATEAPKLLMAVLGDSISAATLADIPIPMEGNPQERVERWAKQGAGAQWIYENKKTLSWASGREISSHYLRLREYLKKNGDLRQLDVLNVARPHDQTDALERQANRVVEEVIAQEYVALKYVTILIGSNDACSTAGPWGTPLDKMRENLRRAFKKLSEIQQDEPIRVLLVGIPRIPELGAPRVRSFNTLFGLLCETVRDKILHFCDPLLVWNDPVDFGQKLQVVESKNQMLRDFAQKAKMEFPSLDVFYSHRFAELEISMEGLAADCFHPSKYGQSVLAEILWEDQPWFRAIPR